MYTKPLIFWSKVNRLLRLVIDFLITFRQHIYQHNPVERNGNYATCKRMAAHRGISYCTAF